MKMHEKLGIDLTTVEGLTKVLEMGCADIPDNNNMNNTEECKSCSGDCEECIARRLFTEVPTKKVRRWDTIKTEDELLKEYTKFNNFCSKEMVHCSDCRYENPYGINCFAWWLFEEIEVEAD